MSAAKISSGLTRRMRSADPVSPQIRPQRLRNDNGAIGILVVLEDAGDRARQRKARSIQCVNKARLVALCRAKANVGATSLEIGEVAARRHFEPRTDTGRPRLQVERHRGREAGIAGGEELAPVRNA